MLHNTNGYRTVGWKQMHNDVQYHRSFPKQDPVIMQYMLSAWLFRLLDGPVYYEICPGAIEQVMAMTNNLMYLGYTYAKRKLKKTPNIFYKITHICRIIA